MTIPLTPAKPGRLNRPAWFRTHVAGLGPVRKTDGEHGPVHTHDAYLDGELIGAVVGTLTEPGGLRRWAPATETQGIRPHGTTRFEAIDALVRAHLPAPRASSLAA